MQDAAKGRFFLPSGIVCRFSILLAAVVGLHFPAAAQEAKPEESAGGVPVASSYVLGPNDQVLIEVFEEDDLRTNTLISKDGSIDFPLIGNVKIGGLTQTQARDRISEMLQRRFLVSPQVSLSVIKFSHKRFTMLGQISKPGSYDLPDQESIDLLEAIAMAGGYTRISESTRITIKRSVNNEEKVFTVNAKKMAKEPNSPRFIVLPGDTITVPESIF